VLPASLLVYLIKKVESRSSIPLSLGSVDITNSGSPPSIILVFVESLSETSYILTESNLNPVLVNVFVIIETDLLQIPETY
jgi:hypothetical protein